MGSMMSGPGNPADNEPERRDDGVEARQTSETEFGLVAKGFRKEVELIEMVNGFDTVEEVAGFIKELIDEQRQTMDRFEERIGSGSASDESSIETPEFRRDLQSKLYQLDPTRFGGIMPRGSYRAWAEKVDAIVNGVDEAAKDLRLTPAEFRSRYESTLDALKTLALQLMEQNKIVHRMVDHDLIVPPDPEEP